MPFRTEPADHVSQVRREQPPLAAPGFLVRLALEACPLFLTATPDADEAAACFPWLEAEVELVAPHAIVALGATAAQALLGKRHPAAARRRAAWVRRAARGGEVCTFGVCTSGHILRGKALAGSGPDE